MNKKLRAIASALLISSFIFSAQANSKSQERPTISKHSHQVSVAKQNGQHKIASTKQIVLAKQKILLKNKKVTPRKTVSIVKIIVKNGTKGLDLVTINHQQQINQHQNENIKYKKQLR